MYLHYQAGVDWTIEETQARMRDTLDPFGGDTNKGDMGQFASGQNFLMTGYELSAMARFFNGLPEADGNLRGYLSLCTKARAPLAGLGNGGLQHPDGSVLLS